ncbi:Transposon Tf2-9 polyprotein, partial [Dictyocoela roeselum]
MKKCAEEKNYHKTIRGENTINYSVNDINQILAVDLKGPIPSKHYKSLRTKKHDKFYILILTDLYSRYTKSKILWSITSRQICKAFQENWINKYGPPKNCLSDNGRQFTSKEFEDFLSKNNINHIKTAPYNPTGNSIVERINQEVGVILRIVRGKSINEIQKGIERRINCTTNMTTRYPPKEIFLLTSIFKNYDKPIRIDKEEINKRIINNKERYIKNINNATYKRKYNIGEKIYIKNQSPDKVAKLWLGPYTIAKL